MTLTLLQIRKWRSRVAMGWSLAKSLFHRTQVKFSSSSRALPQKSWIRVHQEDSWKSLWQEKVCVWISSRSSWMLLRYRELCIGLSVNTHPSWALGTSAATATIRSSYHKKLRRELISRSWAPWEEVSSARRSKFPHLLSINPTVHEKNDNKNNYR